jgi:hypothetical protein
MSNDFLQLEDGQLLKIIPISKDKLYYTVDNYFIRDLGKWFIDDDIIKHFKMEWSEWRNKIDRQRQYYIFVEYRNELKIIKFGNQIKTKIDKRYNDIFDHLQVVVEMKHGYKSYENCDLAKNLNDNSKYDNLDKYFKSDEYKHLISVYDKWNTNLQLKNNPDVSKYLLDNGFIAQDYTTLFRSIKLKKLQNLINRRKIINKILHKHINTNTDYTELVTAIEEWHDNDCKK